MDIFLIVQQFVSDLNNLVPDMFRWVSVFVVILGTYQAAKGMFAFYMFIVSIIRKKGIIKGTLYSYHYTRYENATKFREIELKFKRNLFNQLTVKTIDRDKQLVYKGTVVKEADQLLFELKTQSSDILGNKQSEEIQLR